MSKLIYIIDREECNRTFFYETLKSECIKTQYINSWIGIDHLDEKKFNSVKRDLLKGVHVGFCGGHNYQIKRIKEVTR